MSESNDWLLPDRWIWRVETSKWAAYKTSSNGVSQVYLDLNGELMISAPAYDLPPQEVIDAVRKRNCEKSLPSNWKWVERIGAKYKYAATFGSKIIWIDNRGYTVVQKYDFEEDPERAAVEAVRRRNGLIRIANGL